MQKRLGAVPNASGGANHFWGGAHPPPPHPQKIRACYGSNQKEHDNNLKSVLERLQSRNLTLNKLKCEFNKTSVEYFGYVFSSQGISPDPRKVEAIRNSQPPSNPNEVRRFLGMVNFCARFIPNLATLAKPLRDLTKQMSSGNGPVLNNMLWTASNLC